MTRAQEIDDRLKHFESGDSCELTDIEAICQLALMLPNNATILETGTFVAKAACAWSLATNGTVYTIELVDRYRDEMLKNIRSVDLQDRVIPICADSRTYDWDRVVDCVWLDSNHDFDIVNIEIKKYLPFAKYLICGHDYDHVSHSGVKEAVDLHFNDVKTIKLACNNSNVWYKEIE